MNLVNLLSGADILQDFINVNKNKCTDLSIPEKDRKEIQEKCLAADESIQLIHKFVRENSNSAKFING
jgi:hypothetical protein